MAIDSINESVVASNMAIIANAGIYEQVQEFSVVEGKGSFLQPMKRGSHKFFINGLLQTEEVDFTMAPDGFEFQGPANDMLKAGASLVAYGIIDTVYSLDGVDGAGAKSGTLFLGEARENASFVTVSDRLDMASADAMVKSVSTAGDE